MDPIERQIREQVAREIEAQLAEGRAMLKIMAPDLSDDVIRNNQARFLQMEQDAKIARTGKA